MAPRHHSSTSRPIPLRAGARVPHEVGRNPVSSGKKRRKKTSAVSAGGCDHSFPPWIAESARREIKHPGSGPNFCQHNPQAKQPTSTSTPFSPISCTLVTRSLPPPPPPPPPRGATGPLRARDSNLQIHSEARTVLSTILLSGSSCPLFFHTPCVPVSLSGVPPPPLPTLQASSWYKERVAGLRSPGCPSCRPDTRYGKHQGT